jgi:hypothetical protein
MRPARTRFAILTNETGQNGQHVGGGFSRAGFGAADHIASGQRVRQHGALHGRRLFEAPLIERVEQRGLGDERPERQGRGIERDRGAFGGRRDGRGESASSVAMPVSASGLAAATAAASAAPGSSFVGV